MKKTKKKHVPINNTENNSDKVVKLRSELRSTLNTINTLLQFEVPDPVKNKREYSFIQYPAQNIPDLAYKKTPNSTISFDSSYKNSTNSFSENTLIKDNLFQGYPYLASLAQNGIVSSTINLLSNEIVSSWIKLKTNDDSVSEDMISQLESRLEVLNVKDIIRQAFRTNFLFGGSAIFIEIDNISTGETLSKRFIPTPYNFKKITNLKVIEPYYCVPINVNTFNPLSKDFYIPEYYSVMGQTIHTSYIETLITNESPILLKPIYNYFGIPMIQLMIEYIERFELFNTYISQILQRMRTYVLSTNMSDVFTNTNSSNPDDLEYSINCAQNLKQRIQAGISSMNNNGMWCIDKESEGLHELNSSISGLSDLIKTAIEQLCIVPKTPATKLLGISPSGMNATGESDLINFYSELDNYREVFARPIIQKIIDIEVMSLFKVENKFTITFDFEPLFIKKLEEQQIQSSQLNDLKNLYENNILSFEEIRKIMKEDLKINIDPSLFKEEETEDLLDEINTY